MRGQLHGEAGSRTLGAPALWRPWSVAVDRVRRSAVYLLALLLAAAALGSPTAGAQLLEGAKVAGTEAYANTRWVLHRPDQDPTDACVGGFFTFQFSATGYFVYNNRHRGSWRVDPQGNIRLKTSKGQMLLLLVTGTTMRSVANAGFLLKKNVFERCPS